VIGVEFSLSLPSTEDCELIPQVLGELQEAKRSKRPTRTLAIESMKPILTQRHLRGSSIACIQYATNANLILKLNFADATRRIKHVLRMSSISYNHVSIPQRVEYVDEQVIFHSAVDQLQDAALDKWISTSFQRLLTFCAYSAPTSDDISGLTWT
jgi:hypothetical protein